MLLINIWQTYKKSNGATNLHEKINDNKQTRLCVKVKTWLLIIYNKARLVQAVKTKLYDIYVLLIMWYV